MVAVADIVRHPSRLLSEPSQITERRPARGFGRLLLLALGLVGLYYILPEIRRYVQIERM